MFSTDQRRLMPMALAVLILALVPALAHANWLGGIEFSQPTPTYMQHGEYVYVVGEHDGLAVFRRETDCTLAFV